MFTCEAFGTPLITEYLEVQKIRRSTKGKHLRYTCAIHAHKTNTGKGCIIKYLGGVLAIHN
jgi:hypothetical protein